MQFLLLLLGVFACSTAVIFIKKSDVDPVLLAGLRLAGAAIVLSPLFLRDLWRHAGAMTWSHVRDSAVPGVVLGVHFITWIIGARMPLAASASLIVNLAPIAMPFFLAAVAAERITRRETQATFVALLGMAILISVDFRLNSTHFWGDLICFGSMLLFAAYLALGRRYRHHPTVWLYLVPLYAVGAVTSFLAAIPLADWSPINWQTEAKWVLGLVLVPTVVGHTLLNNAMRYFRGQVVTVVNMAQFIFAGLMAYITLGETPHWAFYPASIAVVSAGWLATREADSTR